MTTFHLLEKQCRDFLAKQAQKNRLRNVALIDERHAAIDLTTNDYLGLQRDLEFRRRVLDACETLPPGAGASRLLGGDHPVFHAVEEAFSIFKGAEASLLFSSGFLANLAIPSALANSDAAFFSDELNHASIIDGIRQSPLPKASRYIFKHGDYDQLDRMLEICAAAKKFIFIESVYSMDGDKSELARLRGLARAHDAMLIVDEAHAIGVFGKNGCGCVYGRDHDRVISINPCGKALASLGALVCGPQWFIDTLINSARSFIYTTGLSPWMAQSILEALRYQPALEKRRQRLLAMAATTRQLLKQQDFDTGTSDSQIIPILLGSDTNALQWEKRFLKVGIQSRAIRPPTVPEGKARLRLSLHAGLSDQQQETLHRCIKEIR